ncbi:Uncharacterized protein TCM_012269 [Theobroma cacao]|uniref:Uncharacterized protein n=1 Tax=Theobroma cacao TaxID=3641 RepID=A0A061G1N2_THECC|nr:Uncharacterized protein TCM_012269 [Theobroma cacao]
MVGFCLASAPFFLHFTCFPLPSYLPSLHFWLEKFLSKSASSLPPQHIFHSHYHPISFVGQIHGPDHLFNLIASPFYLHSLFTSNFG